MKPLVLGAIMDHFNSDDKTIVNEDNLLMDKESH